MLPRDEGSHRLVRFALLCVPRGAAWSAFEAFASAAVQCFVLASGVRPREE